MVCILPTPNKTMLSDLTIGRMNMLGDGFQDMAYGRFMELDFLAAELQHVKEEEERLRAQSRRDWTGLSMLARRNVLKQFQRNATATEVTLCDAPTGMPRRLTPTDLL